MPNKDIVESLKTGLAAELALAVGKLPPAQVELIRLPSSLKGEQIELKLAHLSRQAQASDSAFQCVKNARKMLSLCVEEFLKRVDDGTAEEPDFRKLRWSVETFGHIREGDFVSICMNCNIAYKGQAAMSGPCPVCKTTENITRVGFEKKKGSKKP